MRYIRFLKTPRIVAEKGTSRSQVYCLITITSDLGDSFLPYNVQLSAELLSETPSDQVVVWRTVQWTSGMRSLAITLPLPRSRTTSPLRVRVGVGAKSTCDEYSSLSGEDCCGTVSAWSAPFDHSKEAVKLAERRFTLPTDQEARIWEETGESIARHLWDAGITLSCHITDLEGLLPPERKHGLRILELGTGCGMVGIAFAQLVGAAQVILTDLPEAQEIVERNISQASLAKGSTVVFEELDWDAELPSHLQLSSSSMDLVVAADCTYNSDSSPALVSTLNRLATISSKVIVAIAMKMRHSSEEIFFDLMAATGFQETKTITYSLPGDVEVGEEIVYLHVYQYAPENVS